MSTEQQLRHELTACKAEQEAIAAGFSGVLVLFSQELEARWGNLAARQRYNEITGKKCHQIFCKKNGACEDCAITRSLASGTIESSTITVEAEEGQADEVVLEIVASPVQQPDGKISGIIVIANNVSEKYALERQLRHTQKMEAIGTLAGGVAHDFNNVLTPIMGYSEIVRLKLEQDSYDGAQVFSHLEEILKAAKRAKSLVEQVLTFSRTMEKKAVLQYMHPIIKEVMKLMRMTLPSTIVIKQEIDESCGRVQIDPVQMHQVLINLCTNASQAMGEAHGELLVRLRPATGSKSGEWLELCVRDTGKGIPPENLERIFEPYFTTNEKTHGTGMGLAMVHGIVTSQGGEIKVESTPGEGAVFTILLPVAADPMAVEKDKGPSEIKRGSGEILLVDDEAQVVQVTGEILKSLGYTVTGTTAAKEALELFTASPEKYDLVFTDLTMPGLTGLELSAKLQEIRKELPVVLITGHADHVAEADARQVGITEFCMKPVSMRELAAVVHRLIGS